VASADRIVQIRQNRLLALQANSQTEYVDRVAVANEVNDSRRLFGERSWPIIDVSRRSIEETAAAILDLYANTNRSSSPRVKWTAMLAPSLWIGASPIVLASKSASRRALLAAASLPFQVEPADIDERAIEQGLAEQGATASDLALALARAKALAVSVRRSGALTLGADQTLALEGRRCTRRRPAPRRPKR